MNVNRLKTNSINTSNSYNNKKAVAFTATPTEILNKLKSLPPLKPGQEGKRRKLLESVAKNFIQLEQQGMKAKNAPARIDYILENINPVPKFFAKTDSENFWLELDDDLQKIILETESKDNSGEIEKISRGRVVKKLLTQLGLNQPDRITIENLDKKETIFSRIRNLHNNLSQKKEFNLLGFIKLNT